MAHKFMRVERRNPVARMRQSMESWLSTGYLHPPTTEDNNNNNDDDDDDEEEDEE